jgi:hypothetical protein
MARAIGCAGYVLSCSIEWQKANGPLPDGFFPDPTDPDERWRLQEFFDEHGGTLLQAFVDSETREREGITLDGIRSLWRLDAERKASHSRG